MSASENGECSSGQHAAGGGTEERQSAPPAAPAGSSAAAVQSHAKAPVSAAAALKAAGAPAAAFVPLSDSHAHLSHVAEEIPAADFEALLAAYQAAWDFPAAADVYQTSSTRAAAVPEGAGLPLIVDIGTEPEDFADRFALLGRRAFVRYALGVWPSDEWLADPQASLAALRSSIESAREKLAPRGIAAIGECGLDYHDRPVDAALKSSERRLFEGQIELALALDLPLIVHSRDAFEDTCAILSAAQSGAGHPLEKVIIHCFGYGPAEAEAFLSLGCLVSFAGNITYKKSEPLGAALKLVPPGRLLMETDSPYLNPMPRRGRPCSSADIVRSYAWAARLLGEDEASFVRRINGNIARIFF